MVPSIISPADRLLHANSFNSSVTSVAMNETGGFLPAATVLTISSYIILIIITITGNCLVIAAFFKEPALQTITNYWIVSLSLTDIILASTVMPLQINSEFYLNKWLLGEIGCDIFICLDVLCSTCSIYHLGLISLDRFLCIRFPFRYPHLRTTKKTVCTIVLTWCWCTLISLPRPLGWKDKAQPNECKMSHRQYMLFGSLMSFYVPLFLSACMYIGIYRLTKQRTQKFRRALKASIQMRGHGSTNQNLLASPVKNSKDYGTLSIVPPNEDNQPCTLNANFTEHQNEVEFEISANSVTIASNGSDDLTMSGWLGSEVLENSEIGPEISPPIFDTRNRTFLFIGSQIQTSLPLPSIVVKNCSAMSLSPSTPIHHEKSQSSAPCVPENCCNNDGTSFQLWAGVAGNSGIRPETAVDSKPTSTTEQRHQWRNQTNNETKRQKKTIVEAKVSSGRQKQEARATKVVVIVFGAFVAFWMPFFLVNTIEPFCATCQITGEVWKWVTFWGYVNSAVNPFIYTYFNRTFRGAIFRVIRFERKRH